MIPVQINNMISEEDLKEISDKVTQKIYIHTDPKTGEKSTYLHIFSEGNVDVGIQMECRMSDKIINYIESLEEIVE